MAADFFKAQMDYIFFICGLGFFITGVVAWMLAGEKPRRLPWPWLMLFGFTHAVSDWLEMAAVSYGGDPAFIVLRTILLTASFAFLFEFGRAGLFALKGISLGRWLTPALLLPVGLNFLNFGWSGVDIASCYLLGALGGLLAGLACCLSGRDLTRAQRRLYLTAAVIFFLYAVSQVFVPRAQFFPANLINDAVFLRYFCVPVQFFTMLLAIGLFIAVWGLWLGSGEKGSAGHSRRKYSLFALMMTLLFVVISLGWLAAEYAGRTGAAGINSDILDSTRIAAATLDLASVSQLYGTPEDPDRAEYAKIKDQLYRIDQATGDFCLARLLALRGGSIIFLVDSEPINSPNYSPPGSIYSEALAEAYQVFSSGGDAVTRPYRDRWGDWVSGLVALKDPGSGLVIALLSMDYEAGRWQADKAKARLAAIGAVMIMAIILVGAFVLNEAKNNG